MNQQNTTIQRWLRKPLWTYTFLGIQTVVFLLMYLFPSLSIEQTGSMFGPYVAIYHEYWRFITPIFIHFGLMHFAVNSVVLYFMGTQIEEIYGHWRFFTIYIASGILGNLASFAMNQAGTISAGSSTALFGLFGAFLVLGAHFKSNPAIQNMVRQFALFVGLSFLFGFFDSSIDIWGHIGGILGGLLLGNIVALPQQRGNYSVHPRIISGLIFLFLVVICFLLGLKKYGLLV
ncbi:MAG: rhomboid family intramembrane serine protease [Enterococcus sp.]